jgi:hypothetical protein
MISRYLEINASDYSGTVLPFADAEDIPGWALDSVKAVYRSV